MEVEVEDGKHRERRVDRFEVVESLSDENDENNEFILANSMNGYGLVEGVGRSSPLVQQPKQYAQLIKTVGRTYFLLPLLLSSLSYFLFFF